MAGLSAASPDLAEADEDCLYLYINVPGTWPPPEPLPVLIWFTGGAFVFGNIYKPDLSRQGKAQNSDVELWSGYDSGLPTGSVNITQTHLKSPS